MKSIDVCLSPDLMHLYSVTDKTVVVVDILRATSCMTTAFAYGIEGITPIADLEVCRQKKKEGYLIAGERDGKKVDGFDLGNSPFEYMQPNINGAKLAFTTTNGTQALARAEGAMEVVIGSFLNIAAVTDHLKSSPGDILILCAGWKGKVNLEDTLFAGAVVEALSAFTRPACDAPLAARHLYASAQSDLYGFLKESSHVQRLAKLNIHEDIRFCLTFDKFSIVPVLRSGVLVV